jgi:hypothetical protein
MFGRVSNAEAEPWWPAADLGAAGAYCGSKGSSRDGPVSVLVQEIGLAVNLDAKRRKYRPEEIVVARVENVGSELILDPPEYQVDRFVGQRWKRVGPKGYGWPRRPPPLLSSGRARCFGFTVPRLASPGRYRVLTPVEYRSDDGLSVIMLSHDFRVLGGPGGKDFARGRYCAAEQDGDRRRPPGLKRVAPHAIKAGERDGDPVRLGTKTKRVHQGEVAVARVENLSGVPVSYKPPYSIERLDAAGWELIATFRLKWHRGPPDRVGPGWVGSCQPFKVPLAARPGRYRFAKHVYSFNKHSQTKQESTLHGQFQVLRGIARTTTPLGWFMQRQEPEGDGG